MSIGQIQYHKEGAVTLKPEKNILKIARFVLLVTGISFISYGAARGEAAVVLGKAIKLCLEGVGIG